MSSNWFKNKKNSALCHEKTTLYFKESFTRQTHLPLAVTVDVEYYEEDV